MADRLLLDSVTGDYLLLDSVSGDALLLAADSSGGGSAGTAKGTRGNITYWWNFQPFLSNPLIVVGAPGGIAMPHHILMLGRGMARGVYRGAARGVS